MPQPDPRNSAASTAASPAVNPAVRAADARYWRGVVALTLVLLALWAALGLGCGVWFAAELNQWQLGGFPLGFWFAQQGAILGFVLLILVYAVVMGWFDRRHRRELQRLGAAAAETGR